MVAPHGVRYFERMIKPEEIVAVIDTREQLPYDLAPLRAVRKTLHTGDYSLLGYEDEICIERKSFDDYIGVIGQSRERWERQIERMLEFRVKAIIVEATWKDLENGSHRSKVHPNAIMGSTLGWISKGIPILPAGDRASAQKATTRLLYVIARREKARLIERENEYRDFNSRVRSAEVPRTAESAPFAVKTDG